MKEEIKNNLFFFFSIHNGKRNRTWHSRLLCKQNSYFVVSITDTAQFSHQIEFKEKQKNRRKIIEKTSFRSQRNLFVWFCGLHNDGRGQRFVYNCTIKFCLLHFTCIVCNLSCNFRLCISSINRILNWSIRQTKSTRCLYLYS